jgi:chorismate lyase/3-hydroxybenzoate synthase
VAVVTALRAQSTVRPYTVRYVADANVQIDAHTLACVRFGRGLSKLDDPRCIHVELEQLGAAPQAQLWRSESPVQHGVDDTIAYAHNGEVLFGSIHLEESDLRHVDHAAFRSYVRLDRLMQKFGYPCWQRVWIYMADITRGEGDSERYRQFSLGRHRALSLKPGFEQNLPAATAIGTRGEGLTIYFLAGKQPGIQVENPRQVSAFNYPREYGPSSPSFSRATLRHWAGGAHLYVSGTASIVGHASQHPDDPVMQLSEVANNIRALVQNAVDHHFPGASPSDCLPLGLKLYLRDRRYLPALQASIPQLFGAAAPIICMEGDICRRDLLLEVEGIYAMPGAAA